MFVLMKTPCSSATTMNVSNDVEEAELLSSPVECQVLTKTGFQKITDFLGEFLLPADQSEAVLC